jgi:hypothetical protein
MVSKVRPVKQLIELYEPGEGKAQVIDRPGQLNRCVMASTTG